jgi:hypothetical protein
MGVGTTSKFYVENSTGVLEDKTPFRLSALPADPLATTNGSPTLTITHVAHGRSVGDLIMLYGSNDIGGFVADNINTIHEIASVPSVDTMTVTMGSNATSTVASGGGALISVYYKDDFTVPLITDPLATTNGSTEVTVTHANHDANAGDFVKFSGASVFNNVTISGDYEVVEVVNANSFIINAATTANATGSGGGAACRVVYYMNTGASSFSYGTGWGSGGWGSGGWGEGESSGFGGAIRLWTSSQFGQNILAAPRGGPIYYYDVDTQDRMYDIRLDPDGFDVPGATNVIMVSPEDRRAICFGATDITTGVFDPLLIRWADDGSFLNFTQSDSTTAGELRLSIGSQIVTATKARSEILIWTENSLSSMRFMDELIFGISLISPNVDIVGPNAAIVVDDAVYWMGRENFFMYNGRAQSMPCSVREYVFGDINLNQTYKICASSNRLFREIRWDYPSSDSSENDRYVVFNYAENLWYFGTMERTAWSDAGFGPPIAASIDGYVYTHEIGLDDGSTNPPTAIEAYVESAPIEIEEGSRFLLLTKMVPDVSFSGSTIASPSVDLLLTGRKYPGSADTSGNTPSGTVSLVASTVDQTTEKLDLRMRARQFTMKISSNDLGVDWRLGSQRFEIRPDGRKI